MQTTPEMLTKAEYFLLKAGKHLGKHFSQTPLIFWVESKLQLKKLLPESADWLAGFLIASHS